MVADVHARAALSSALTLSEEEVEHVARAVCCREHNSAYIWEGAGFSDDLKEYWRKCARAVLAALREMAEAGE